MPLLFLWLVKRRLQEFLPQIKDSNERLSQSTLVDLQIECTAEGEEIKVNEDEPYIEMVKDFKCLLLLEYWVGSI